MPTSRWSGPPTGRPTSSWPRTWPSSSRANQVAEKLDIQPAWEGGSRGVLSAKRAREEGFSKLTAADRAEIANVYRIGSRALWPTTRRCSRKPARSWIRIEGRLDPIKEAYLRRRGSTRPAARGSTSSSFRSTAKGGLIGPADNVADADRRHQGHEDRRLTSTTAPLGVSALVALACDDIVFRSTATDGRRRRNSSPAANNQVQEAPPRPRSRA